jgi:hypothetical protein
VRRGAGPWVMAAQSLANHCQTGAEEGQLRNTCVNVASRPWQLACAHKWLAAVPLWMCRLIAPTKSLPWSKCQAVTLVALSRSEAAMTLQTLDLEVCDYLCWQQDQPFHRGAEAAVVEAKVPAPA